MGANSIKYCSRILLACVLIRISDQKRHRLIAADKPRKYLIRGTEILTREFVRLTTRLAPQAVCCVATLTREHYNTLYM